MIFKESIRVSQPFVRRNPAGFILGEHQFDKDLKLQSVDRAYTYTRAPVASLTAAFVNLNGGPSVFPTMEVQWSSCGAASTAPFSTRSNDANQIASLFEIFPESPYMVTGGGILENSAKYKLIYATAPAEIYGALNLGGKHVYRVNRTLLDPLTATNVLAADYMNQAIVDSTGQLTPRVVQVGALVTFPAVTSTALTSGNSAASALIVGMTSRLCLHCAQKIGTKIYQYVEGGVRVIDDQNIARVYLRPNWGNAASGSTTVERCGTLFFIGADGTEYAFGVRAPLTSFATSYTGTEKNIAELVKVLDMSGSAVQSLAPSDGSIVLGMCPEYDTNSVWVLTSRETVRYTWDATSARLVRTFSLPYRAAEVGVDKDYVFVLPYMDPYQVQVFARTEHTTLQVVWENENVGPGQIAYALVTLLSTNGTHLSADVKLTVENAVFEDNSTTKTITTGLAPVRVGVKLTKPGRVYLTPSV